MGIFTIKDLAEFSGVKQHTIRIWEHRYAFLQPQRSSSLHRTYTSEELRMLLDVALLNKSGYRISIINKMTLEEKLQLAEKIIDQQQRAINELIVSMAKMDVGHFEKTLDTSIATWGIHGALQKVIIPFCHKIGLLEKSFNKNYLENILLVRHIIKQKFYLGIEKAITDQPKNKLVVLFLSSGETQELPILSLQYALKLQGYQVIYLGPIDGSKLETICRQCQPHFIITHATKKVNGTENIKAVEQLLGLSSVSKFISVEHDYLGGNRSDKYSVVPTVPEAAEMFSSVQ